jgi:2-polyprenyl-6-methoxyphenol hydroxylase-like FAD-dependent oxidoreductase
MTPGEVSVRFGDPQKDIADLCAERPYFLVGLLEELTKEAELVHDFAETPEGGVTVRADLIVGADGRHSTVRAKAGLETLDLGAPMDVLWLRLSRRPTDPGQTLGRIDAGMIFVMLNRGDYWQRAFVIPKGGFELVHQAGLASFCEEIVRLAPYLRDRVGELGDWTDIKLLTVAEISDDDLRAVQRRREFPARAMQGYRSSCRTG